MATSKVTFFDLGSNGPKNKAWNSSAWRTRFVLNYKGLDYETEWLEYPDIRPRLKDHVPEDVKICTIPTVIMPDGTYIMDSSKIANAIEKICPSPSLHLDSPLREKVEAYIACAHIALAPVSIPNVPRRLLNERSHEYWHETRSNYTGMPLDQYEKEQGGDGKPYKAAAPHLQAVTAILNENLDGPFFMGSTISYTDFVWAGFLTLFRRIGDDVFWSVLEATGDGAVHQKLLDKLERWSARDDH
ncbi:putative glutathione S-transferase [Astrocystis sublimbata]|nr:putative glutathione S-transferase [Astrocystis sublimbata]